MKNKKGIIHLLPLLLVGVLIIAVGGYILYFGPTSAPDGQNSEKPLVIKEENIIKEKETEREIINDLKENETLTLDWKTHNAPTYTIKYPPDLKAKIKSNGEISLFTESTMPEREGVENYTEGVKLAVTILETSQTAEEYATSEIKKVEEYRIIKSLSPVKIGNLQGVTYTVEGLGVFKHIILDTNQNSIFNIVDWTIDLNDNGYHEIVEQILSTFEFIE